MRTTQKGTKKIPWTIEEDDLIAHHYPLIGATATQKFLPRRSISAVVIRAAFIGVNYAGDIRHQSGADAMQAEKDLIVGEVRYMINAVCAKNPKLREESLTLLGILEQTNQPSWWWAQKSKPLGRWLEMFVRGYKYVPIGITRDDFLNAEGLFGESPFEPSYADAW